MEIVDRQTLQQITGGSGHGRAVSDLGIVVLDNHYSPSLLESMAVQAIDLWNEREHSQDDKYLGLDHVRGAQTLIAEVAELMTDPRRLEALSEVAGVELEPYPIPSAAAHINHYEPGAPPIDLHTDGTAIVELIPLRTTGPQEDGTTVIYQGDPDTGKRRQAQGDTFDDDELIDITQQVGRSVLMQGRMLLHGVRALRAATRTTLIMALRSTREPWKDGNTLARLLLDDDLEEVERPWIDDQVHISNLYRQQQVSGR